MGAVACLSCNAPTGSAARCPLTPGGLTSTGRCPRTSRSRRTLVPLVSSCPSHHYPSPLPAPQMGRLPLGAELQSKKERRKDWWGEDTPNIPQALQPLPHSISVLALEPHKVELPAGSRRLQKNISAGSGSPNSKIQSCVS